MLNSFVTVDDSQLADDDLVDDLDGDNQKA